MPKKSDDQKRKEEAAAMKQVLNEERLKEERLKKKAAEEAQPSKKHLKEKSNIAFKYPTTTLSPAHKVDWKKIVADFEKQFHHGLEKDGTMLFTTMEEATTFFKGQAEQEKRHFFVTECKKGQMLDHHFYSCADGHLYQGTYLEIEAQLAAAVKSHPENTMTAEGLTEFRSFMPSPTPNPATEMREHIKDQRNLPEEETPTKTLTAK